MFSELFPGLVLDEFEGSGREFFVVLRGPDPRPMIDHARREFGARVICVFAEDRRPEERLFYVSYILETPGEKAYLILQAPVPEDDPRFPSLSVELPSLNWQEREIQDWFGLTAEGHPNPRRVALHDDWPEIHPLRKDFPLETVLEPFEGERHIFRPAEGEGVFQVPVGPVHAGIIEPGHFHFDVAGEPILYLQIRLFYTHKATEKRFEQIPISRGVHLAECISGDSSVAHAVAYCQAIEKAAGIEAPERAQWMRTILLELERLYNHTGDIGAIVNDVGFGIAQAHAGRLRERLLGLNEHLTGSRLLRGMVRLGGIRHDWDMGQLARLHQTLDTFSGEFRDLIELIESSDSTRDRLEHTGVLTPEKARDLGVVGVAARASGVDRDVRRDHPYAAYGRLAPRVPVFSQGDVWSRVQVRIAEVRESVALVRAAARELPGGTLRVAVPPLIPNSFGLGAVEGWRGEILHWVRTGPDGYLDRCKIKDPSINNWPALVEAVEGNILPDFPVINKSFNLSYSGTDR
jgi:Ni,Fe-hydrogenase III large subunit/Ni,Fe-hydrogenase III component G